MSQCPNCKREVEKYTGRVVDKEVLYTCENCEERTYTAEYIKQHPNYQAFMVDKKTGQPYAIDDKGRRHRVEDTPYKYDNRGWKRAGKAPRKRTYFT